MALSATASDKTEKLRSDVPWDRRSTSIVIMLMLAVPATMGGALALAPMAAVLGVLAAPWADIRRLARKGGWPLILFAAFIAWALISALWSANPSPRQVPKLFGGAVTGVLLLAAFAWRPADASSAAIRKAIVAFAFLTAILGLIEWLGAMPLNRLGHWGGPTSFLSRAPMMGTAVLVVCMWGALAILWRGGWRGRLAAAALLAASLANSLLSEMNAAVIATLLAAAGFAASLVLGPIILRICGYLGAGWLLTAPAILSWLARTADPETLPSSWEQRLAIWRVVPGEVLASPLFGRGLNSFRVLSPNIPTLDSAIQPMHPHCFALHIWFELGAVGALLAASALVALVNAGAVVLRDQPLALAACTAAFIAAFAISNVSYGAWAEWWIGAMFLAGGMAFAARSPQPARTG